MTTMTTTKAMRLLLLVPAIALLNGCGYNRIQELEERVNQTEGNIESELMRRNDLIPNLVATVDEAAEFEQETFTQVAQARAGLQQSREQLASAVQGDATPAQLSQAAQSVGENLRLFLNVAVEAYPQLNATQNFQRLQDELAETENRINVSRRDYNESVATYNSYIRQFPQVITAKVTGAERREPFEAPAGAEAAPQVQFD